MIKSLFSKLYIIAAWCCIIAIIGIEWSCQRSDLKKPQNSDATLYFELHLPVSDGVLNIIRTIIIEQNKSLSENEATFILETIPKVSYYQMADSFGQYSWHWDLPTERALIVNYVGDLKHIEKDQVSLEFIKRNK